jgi:hypothetical protein
MAESASHGSADSNRVSRRRVAPIRVRPAEVAPISEQDQQQAVSVLATMILEWLREYRVRNEP